MTNQDPMMSSRYRLPRATVWLVALFGLLLLPAGRAMAESWWNNEWTQRKKITVDTTSAGSAISDPIGGTTLLVRLHDGNFQFNLAKPDASDLRFVADDDKTVLPHHVEKWDTLLNEGYAWVKVPEIKAGGKTSLWLYFGNAGPKGVKAEDVKGSYDTDTLLVYHFSERNTPPQDATGQHPGLNAGIAVEGALIAGGVRLDESGGIRIATSPALTWPAGSALTWSAWVKTPALQPDAALFTRTDGGNTFVIGLANGVPYVAVNGQRTPAGAALTPNTWRHLAVVAEPAKITLYVDGASQAALPAGLPALSGESRIGGEGAGAFIGDLDELQISKTARPAGWVKLAAAGQGGDRNGKLLTFSSQEAPKGWLSWLEEGYFAVIIKNLTFDGWLVIGILAIMSVVSWVVMVGKARYLSRIRAGNVLFAREWDRVTGDLALLDESSEQGGQGLGGPLTTEERRALRHSPNFRIFRAGSESIQRRLSLRPDQPRSLTTRAIQAVKAKLDGAQVLETETLNSKIVLLTIAISGGPFLGLLGTVVGVMITFAAVAAAGEVNVNAIAPGIAAALLATVAGLAVAIPALFGYNYLLTRIKETNNRMHVFIDEFVTSMAEHYRGGPPD